MAVGLGIKFLNLNGFAKDSRLAKVERYAEIVGKLHAQIPPPEPQQPENEGEGDQQPEES